MNVLVIVAGLLVIAAVVQGVRLGIRRGDWAWLVISVVVAVFFALAWVVVVALSQWLGTGE